MGQASRCYGTRKAFGWIVSSDGELADALRFASAAAKLGQDDADALANAAYTFAYALDDLHSGRAFVDQALALNPNLAAAWSTSGWIKVWECDPEGALEHLARSLRLSPVGTDATRSATASAHACFYLERYDEALVWANRALKSDPPMHAALRIAAASAALSGQDHLATQMRMRLMVIDPSFNAARLEGMMGAYSRPEFPAKYAEGLRKAQTNAPLSLPSGETSSSSVGVSSRGDRRSTFFCFDRRPKISCKRPAWRREKMPLKQRATNSVLNSRSQELWRQTA